jgi:hypothetical protein
VVETPFRASPAFKKVTAAPTSCSALSKIWQRCWPGSRQAIWRFNSSIIPPNLVVKAK